MERIRTRSRAFWLAVVIAIIGCGGVLNGSGKWDRALGLLFAVSGVVAITEEWKKP